MLYSKIEIEKETTENVVALIQLSSEDLRSGNRLAKIMLAPAVRELAKRYKRTPSIKKRFSEMFNALAGVQDLSDIHEVAEAVKNTKPVSYTPRKMPNTFRDL